MSDERFQILLRELFEGDDDRLRDVLRPLNGNWFEKPYPTRVLRLFCRLPVLPFLAFRWPFLDKACYLGFKVFGVDAPAYRGWPVGISRSDVYPGSQALCPSFRPFARLE